MNLKSWFDFLEKNWTFQIWGQGKAKNKTYAQVSGANHFLLFSEVFGVTKWPKMVRTKISLKIPPGIQKWFSKRFSSKNDKTEIMKAVNNQVLN